MNLEEFHTGTRVKGLVADGPATVEMVQWIGEQAVKVIFRDEKGNLGDRMVFRDDEASMDLVAADRPWSFVGHGALLRLVSEAHRIKLAWLFDPFVAINTCLVEPLPHQISSRWTRVPSGSTSSRSRAGPPGCPG